MRGTEGVRRGRASRTVRFRVLGDKRARRMRLFCRDHIVLEDVIGVLILAIIARIVVRPDIKGTRGCHRPVLPFKPVRRMQAGLGAVLSVCTHARDSPRHTKGGRDSGGLEELQNGETAVIRADGLLGRQQLHRPQQLRQVAWAKSGASARFKVWYRHPFSISYILESTSYTRVVFQQTHRFRFKKPLTNLDLL